MDYRIDRHSGVATYQQIVQQTRQALRLGVLQPGDKLPTAKEVVAATAINPNTVLKAYRELEREGLVEPRPGRGTFVRRSLAQPAVAPGTRLHADLADWMDRALASGLGTEDIAALCDAVLRERGSETGGETGTQTSDGTGDGTGDQANARSTSTHVREGGEEK